MSAHVDDALIKLQLQCPARYSKLEILFYSLALL